MAEDHQSKKQCVDKRSEPCCFDWEPSISYADRRPTFVSKNEDDVLHQGGCHCGDIRFEVEASSSLIAWDCNCSMCTMKRNTHFVVPKSKLRIIQKEGDVNSSIDPLEYDKLSCYTYGSHTAKHLFCKNCGVCAFYQPRSNPDGWGVTVHCLDPGTVTGIEIKRFNGTDWEGFISGSGIQELSKKAEE